MTAKSESNHSFQSRDRPLFLVSLLTWLPRVFLRLNGTRYHRLLDGSINRACKNDAINPLSPGQTIATCCDVLQHVGCCWLKFETGQFEPTTPNMSQQGGQTHATCCPQQCCDMLCWHVAIVWPEL